ncbi:MAG: hypothetical protein Greene041662_579 [Candidatus Peregrinibacteria bacterium Greene0416_62]|nr:MAG: hypothetical protein Greene041662_579 [Candidatus Peregrinibacteria bacterium Greene0416_62]TSC99706.1 MAG: hypothetical protein Greene101449_571 [Candidatus Peregrinibacteria bacterium Greene1014_49]
MRKLILLLVLLGISYQARAEGRVAVFGVPVLGQGNRTLYTTPPNVESQYDDNGHPMGVPYSSTPYAWNHPSNLTLVGYYNGQAVYGNSNGYTSSHYGEHYTPMGGLSPGYSGYGYASGGNLREYWVPIDRRIVPTMPVTTRPMANAGCSPAIPVPTRSIPPPRAIGVPSESRTEVGYYTVPEGNWASDGQSFVDGNKTSWKLATGDAVHESLRSTKVKGYLVTVTHLDGTEKTYLHFVEWVDKKWRPTGQIWE